MTAKITSEQRAIIEELLEVEKDRNVIAERACVTPGQVSAIAAHRTMRRRKAASASQQEHSASESAQGKTVPDSKSVPLGVAGSHRVGWNPLDTANPHLMIVGESGSGKTYSTSCLIAELAQRGIPTILFDYGQGFTPETVDPIFAAKASPLQLEVGRKGVAISPFEIFDADAHGPLSVAQRVADTLVRVYPNLGIQQHAMIRQAVLDVLEDGGIHAGIPSTWKKSPPRFGRLHEFLNDRAQEVGSPDRQTARSAASHIASLFLFDVFRSNGVPIQWAELLGARQRCTVIQLRGLEQSLQRATTEFLLWNLLAYFESLGPQSLKCFVAIDEAHRIPTGDGSAVERLLREGRKFGIGVILASQQPEDFTSIAFSNTATKLIFQITDERATVTKQLFKKLKSPMSFADLHKTVTTLERGHAFALIHNTGNAIRVTSLTERFVEPREDS